MKLDMEQNRVLHLLAPPDSSGEINLVAFAVLTGAAAAAAARFNDELDLGSDLSPKQRYQWGVFCSLCLELADLTTPNSEEPRPRETLIGKVFR